MEWSLVLRLVFPCVHVLWEARGLTTLWTRTFLRMPARVFVEKILYSSRIKKLFEKYASLSTGASGEGEKVMTMDDFVRSCQDTSVIDVIKYSQLRSLYRIIRG